MKAQNRPLGALMVLAATTLIASLEGISKSLIGGGLPPVQVFALRFLAHFIILAPFVVYTYRRRLLAEFNTRPQILRSVFLAVSLFLFILALAKMPLARAIALVSVSPFIVAALSPAMLGERVRVINFVFICGGFGGVLLIARPDIGLDWGNILAVGSGAFYALFMIFSRKLPAKAPGLVSSLHVSVTILILVSPVVLFSELMPLTGGQAAAFLLLGAMSACAHYFMARAFSFAEASFLSLFVYWELAAAVIVGFLLHGDIPDGRDWGGIFIIIVCGVAVVWAGRKRAEN